MSIHFAAHLLEVYCKHLSLSFMQKYIIRYSICMPQMLYIDIRFLNG